MVRSVRTSVMICMTTTTDGGQAQRRLRVGADVADRAIEDVAEGQRPQRDDARA